MKSVIEYRREIDELETEIILLQEQLGDDLSARDYKAMQLGAALAKRNAIQSILYNERRGYIKLETK